MRKTCPEDGSELMEDGECGIVDYDGEWEAQAIRYRCVIGDHIIYVADREEVEGPEGE